MQLSKLGAEYSQMLDSLPASETQVLSAARALEIQGDAARACALLQLACERHPSANLQKMLAAMHLKHARFDESARVIEQALEQAPRDVPSILLLAEAQLKGGRHRLAFETLRRAERHGASKLRVFKLERQLDDAPTVPEAPATGPAPPLAGVGEDPSDSAVFEDESFSDLSSFELADGAASFEGNETPGIYDTLVDGFKDDPADRSFDDFLMDLGVPVDPEASADPDRTGSLQVSGDERVAEEWGLDAPGLDASGRLVPPGGEAGPDRASPEKGSPDEASPDDATAAISLDDLRVAPDPLRNGRDRSRQHTPRLQDSPHFERNSTPQNDFPHEKTEVLDFDRDAPASPKQPSSIRPPSNQPSWLERNLSDPESSRPSTNRPASNRPASNQPASTRPALPRLKQGGEDFDRHSGPDSANPHSSNPHPSNSASARPLPPSVQQGRRNRRRPTGQSRSIARPDALVQPRADRDGPRPATEPSPMSRMAKIPWKYAVPSAAALLILIVAGVLFAASSSAASAAGEELATYRSLSAADTYQGYLAGEKALQRALGAESFLGRSSDEFLSQMGLMGDAHVARAEALAELAKLKAMIEYRYERLDTHQSSAVIEQAESSAGGDPRLDVARSYRLLAEGRPDEAAQMLEVVRKNFPGFAGATTALLHAYLDDDSLQSASMAATALNKLEAPTVHQHYVLGLFESRQGKAAADARLQHLIETLSPKHVSARIARSYTLRRGDDEKGLQEALTLLKEVLGPLRAGASPLQRADAHIALGALYAEDESRARAEEQFRKAIKVVPSRSSVYAPLIALYRDDGRLDKSLELIDDAVNQGATSPGLVLRKAEILRLTGRAESALRALTSAPDGEDAPSSARSKWLEGMALLDLGRLTEARKAFEAAREKSDEFSPGRAYLLMAQELESGEARDAISPELDRLLEKFSTDTHVLRAGALAAMHVAAVTRSRSSRKDLLARAEKLLEKAMVHGGNEAMLLFDLCRQQMLSDEGQDASISCRKARRINDTYLPGLLTMAELERRRGHPDKAIELLAELDERFADKPRISQMKADAHLERHEIEAAEKEINRWAGTEYAQSPLHLIVEGRLAFSRERYTSALGYFQRAHKHAPNDARAGLYYAHTLTRLGEHDRAEKLVKEYLTDLEGEPIAWLVFGEIRRRQGRFSDARENLGLALQKLGDAISPPWRTSQAYTQLAQTWADRYGFDHRFVGRYLYRGSERGDENFPALNKARGIYHLRRRRPDEQKAAEAFEKVIAVAPFDCPSLESLQKIYASQDAKDALERVGRLHTEHCED